MWSAVLTVYSIGCVSHGLALAAIAMMLRKNWKQSVNWAPIGMILLAASSLVFIIITFAQVVATNRPDEMNPSMMITESVSLWFMETCLGVTATSLLDSMERRDDQWDTHLSQRAILAFLVCALFAFTTNSLVIWGVDPTEACILIRYSAALLAIGISVFAVYKIHYATQTLTTPLSHTRKQVYFFSTCLLLWAIMFLQVPLQSRGESLVSSIRVFLPGIVCLTSLWTLMTHDEWRIFRQPRTDPKQGIQILVTPPSSSSTPSTTNGHHLFTLGDGPDTIDDHDDGDDGPHITSLTLPPLPKPTSKVLPRNGNDQMQPMTIS